MKKWRAFMKDQEYATESMGREDLFLLRDFALNFLSSYPYCIRIGY